MVRSKNHLRGYYQHVRGSVVPVAVPSPPELNTLHNVSMKISIRILSLESRPLETDDQEIHEAQQKELEVKIIAVREWK